VAHSRAMDSTRACVVERQCSKDHSSIFNGGEVPEDLQRCLEGHGVRINAPEHNTDEARRMLYRHKVHEETAIGCFDNPRVLSGKSKEERLYRFQECLDEGKMGVSARQGYTSVFREGESEQFNDGVLSGRHHQIFLFFAFILAGIAIASIFLWWRIHWKKSGSAPRAREMILHMGSTFAPSVAFMLLQGIMVFAFGVHLPLHMYCTCAIFLASKVPTNTDAVIANAVVVAFGTIGSAYLSLVAGYGYENIFVSISPAIFYAMLIMMLRYCADLKKREQEGHVSSFKISAPSLLENM